VRAGRVVHVTERSRSSGLPRPSCEHAAPLRGVTPWQEGGALLDHTLQPRSGEVIPRSALTRASRRSPPQNTLRSLAFPRRRAMLA
jgi:hypothetical protein